MKTKTPSLLYSLVTIMMVTIGVVLAFEVAKELFLPNLSRWDTRSLTIAFVTIEVTAATYFVLRREQKLRQRLLEEMDQRGRLEAMAERARELEQMTQELETQVAERKRAEETLRESAERLRLAIDIARIGTWDWDATTGQVSSGGVPRFPLFGHDLQTYEGFFERVHPEDREVVGEAMAFSVVENVPYNVEFRVVSPDDGSIRWIAAGGQMFRDTNGKAVRMIGVAQDITERKQTEERLEQERTLLRILIDNLPDYIYVRNRENQFLMGNRAVAQLMGATPEALVGKTDFDFFAPEMAEQFHADDIAVMETGVPLINKEEINRNPAGMQRYVLTTKVPLRDKNGDIIGIVGIGRDITERKRMEMALLESRTRLDDILHSLQAVVWSADAETFEPLFLNHATEKIFGYPPYEFFEDPGFWLKVVHPEDRERLVSLRLALPRDGTHEIEFRIVRPDGEVRWLHDRAQAISDKSGKIIRLDGITSDITERKRAEERLSEERNLLRTLIDHLPHYIYVKDTQGRFVLDNLADARAMGNESPEAVIGKTDFDLYPRELAAKFYADDMTVIHTGQPLVNREELATNDQGDRIWTLTSKWPLRDRHGQIIGLVGIGMDMTERKQAEQQAIELGTQRARVKMLADFVRDASHDFRTPLSTINTSLYLLQRANDPEQREHRIAMIQEQTSHLARLVEGLLTMTRLDSEGVFNYQRLDLNRLLAEVHMRMAAQAAEKQVEMALDLARSALPVQADSVELGEALMKLVENAVQYTPAGGRVTLRSLRDADCAVIEIRDTGIGISSDDLPHIFERFFRADKARSAQTGGVGLGLPIALKIVEAHKGRIEVASVLGECSTFRVILPMFA